MTISSEVNKIQYDGDNSTTVFSFPFKIFSNTDIQVYTIDSSNVFTLKTLTTDYTVSINDGEGGSVTFLSAPASTVDVLIIRVLNYTQPTDIPRESNIPEKSLEDAYDRATMLIQQVEEQVERSIKFSETSTLDTEITDSLVSSAGKTIIINSGETGLELGPTADEISTAQASATAAAASASAASTSETNAATSETNAAASAAAAAATLNSAFFRDVVYIDNTDSPLTIDSTYNGKLLSIDSSGGAITINLPTIAGLTLPFNIAMNLTTGGNSVTINRGGTDTIQGATSKVLALQGEGVQLVAEDELSPDRWEANLFGSVADSGVTRAKLAYGAVANNAITTKTADFTADEDTEDVILIDGISDDITCTLPAVAGVLGKVFEFKRVDDVGRVTDGFIDANITLGTDNINITSHPFTDLQRVQLTTAGTLPTGLALATDYYVIVVDADNIKLASSRANAIADTAVDITASGGGNHTITSQYNTVTIDGNGSEEIEGETTYLLYGKKDRVKIISDGTSWQIIDRRIPNETCYLRDEKSSATAGGTFTAASYLQRTLNTTNNSQEWITLATNQFTLDAGVYKITARAPAYRVGNHKAIIYDVDDSATELLGTTERMNTAEDVQTWSVVEGTITLTTTKTFDVRHYAANTRATDGWGEPAGFGDNEVYTTCKIDKIR